MYKLANTQSAELAFASLRLSSTILWNSFSLLATRLLTVSKVVSRILQPENIAKLSDLRGDSKLSEFQSISHMGQYCSCKLSANESTKLDAQKMRE